MTQKIERMLIAVKPWQNHLPLSASRVSHLARGLEAEVALTSCVRLSALTEALGWADPTAAIGLGGERFDQENDELAELERLAQPLRDAGVLVSTQVRRHARADQGILDEAADWKADLLIAGIHEPRPSLGPRLANVDWQLMRLCPSPLLLTRARGDEPYRTILAAVDPLHGHAEPEGLDHALLRVARYFRDALESELRIANVYPRPDEFEIVSSIEVEPGVFYGTENIEAVHKQAVIDLADECGVADSDLILRAGKPAETLVQLAAEQEADLIVLGSIQRGDLEAALLGSTAERVIEETACDILLVKLSPN